VMAIFVITIAAAEIGVALAIVLLLFRTRQTVELTSVEELGEASGSYTENPAGYPVVEVRRAAEQALEPAQEGTT
jgi:hypothetical protein